MYPLLLLILVLCVSGVHIMVARPGRDSRKVIGIFLMYFLVLFVGISGILGCIGHIFMPDKIARGIGWPSGSPFQFEVAMADFAFGLLGIMCIWLRGHFWTATGVGSSVYFLGAAYSHAKYPLVYKDTAVYNVGPVLYIADIIVPLIVVSLVIAYNVLEE